MWKKEKLNRRGNFFVIAVFVVVIVIVVAVFVVVIVVVVSVMRASQTGIDT